MFEHPFLTTDTPPPPALHSIALSDVPLLSSGKVREMFDLGEHLLMVATDRLSAFDVIMDEPVPGKGVVLSSLSAFWFELLADEGPNHYISDDPANWPAEVQSFADILAGRSLLVRRCERIDVECVVRGYLAGSGWEEYRRQGTLATEPLPMAMIEADRLPEPAFTPAIKAASGHDENISVEQMRELVGSDLTDVLQERSLRLYARAEAHARERGIIVADTKFEFGMLDGQVMLIDEALTPDSSRFWPLDDYEPGSTPPSFDKQPVRDYLTSIGWNRRPPPPPLPASVIRDTTERYREAYRRLTGPLLT